VLVCLLNYVTASVNERAFHVGANTAKTTMLKLIDEQIRRRHIPRIQWLNDCLVFTRNVRYVRASISAMFMESI
jgi:hypothetical protein